MRRKTAGLLAGLALLAMPAAAQQQVLNVAVGGAFTSMDPHFFNLGPNNVLTNYVFEPLTRFDPRYRPEPSLAVSWKPVDAATWEFKLRDGVKYTDGTPFTADDVAFTFTRIPTIMNSPSSFMFAVKPVTRLEVVDDHTIRMHTANPAPLMPFNMATVRIVSRKIGNFYRLTHIQYEDFATAFFSSHKARLQNQLRGFGYGHEITRNFRMSNGNRPALFNLLAKFWDHAACTPQYVAKTHDHKACLWHCMHRTAIASERSGLL